MYNHRALDARDTPIQKEDNKKRHLSYDTT